MAARHKRTKLAWRWWHWLALITAAGALGIATVIIGNGLRMLAVEDQAYDQPGPGRGRWVATGDVQLHVTEQGTADGPRLVLVAGTGAWGGTWASNVGALQAAGWRVITIDLPPFGFSSRPPDRNYTRHAQAQRLLQAIRALGTKPVVLLGHSYGGGPAAEAAMLEPALFSHLILVDAAIGLRKTGDMACDADDLSSTLLTWRPLRTLLVANTATQPLFSGLLLEQFVSRKESVTAQRTAIYRQPLALRGTSAAIGDWAYQFATSCEASRSHSSDGFAQLKTALTLIWGEQDRITPPQQARDIAAVTPRAQLVMLPDVGHIPQIEDANLFNRRLIEILDRLR
jgi:pimeloyl-ACP methyl ester carboxylesterase